MNNPPVFKTALNFGAMNGIGLFAVFLIIYYSGGNPLGQLSWLGAWVPIVFIILATRHYRNHEGQGYLNYWHGFRIGFLTASCGAFLFALMIWGFGTAIDPALVDRYKEENLMYLEQTQELSKSMFGEDIYNSSVEQLEKTTISSIAYQDFFNKAFGGLLIAFITAAFFKNNAPNVTSE